MTYIMGCQGACKTLCVCGCINSVKYDICRLFAIYDETVSVVFEMLVSKYNHRIHQHG